MFRIIDSNVFEAIGVREIGLTSFSIVFVGFTFGNTFADFHESGIITSCNKLLKIAVKRPARILARFFRIQARTLSGPVALFVLTFLSACIVVVKSMTYSSGSWPSTSKASLFLSSRGRCSLTDTKKSFIVLASTFPSVVLLARLCTLICLLFFDPLVFSYFSTNFFPPIQALLQCVFGRTRILVSLLLG